MSFIWYNLYMSGIYIRNNNNFKSSLNILFHKFYLFHLHHPSHPPNPLIHLIHFIPTLCSKLFPDSVSKKIDFVGYFFKEGH